MHEPSLGTPNPPATPPPPPNVVYVNALQTKRGKSNRGKPWGVCSVIIAGVGILPFLVFCFLCLLAAAEGGNPLLILVMGFIGFVIHLVGAITGVVSITMGAKQFGTIGIILNATILVLSFFAILLPFSRL